MNTELYSSLLRGLHGVNLNMRERARAEAGVRASAALVELLVGVAGIVGLRTKDAGQR